MYCNKCGKQIDDGSKFCPNCGESFVSEQEPAKKSKNNDKKKKN